MTLHQTTATWSGKAQCRSPHLSASASRYGFHMLVRCFVCDRRDQGRCLSVSYVLRTLLLVWIHTFTCAVLVMPSSAADGALLTSQTCKTEASAKGFLATRGILHYYDLAQAHQHE